MPCAGARCPEEEWAAATLGPVSTNIARSVARGQGTLASKLISTAITGKRLRNDQIALMVTSAK